MARIPVRFNARVGRSAAQRFGLLAIVGLSTPFALVVESGVRRLVMPAEFEDVRAWLSPDVTPWAWAMAPAAVMATGLGFFLQRWLVARSLKEPRDPALTAEQAQDSAEFDALMLSTSAPQIPALLSTIAFLFGARLTPVLVTVCLATVGVISLGLAIGRPPRESSDSPQEAPED